MAEIIDLEEARRRRAGGLRPRLAPGAQEGRIAARVALRADERGVGRPFGLALERLVSRWDRPVDALETLSEAAGVAGLKLEDVLDAAYDPRRDAELEGRAPLRRAR